MVAGKRTSGKVADSVLLKHLERINAVQAKNGLSDEAICHGLQQAVIAAADNHTYVLKCAAGYKPNSYAPRRQPKGLADYIPDGAELLQGNRVKLPDGTMLMPGEALARYMPTDGGKA